jgi:hypothetical protein
MRRKLLTGLAPLVAVVAFVAVPAVAQATPHFYTNEVKLEEGVKQPIISYGHLSLTAEGATIPTECENAVSGYIENPVGGGAGKQVTEAFTSFQCKNTECEAAGGKIGVVFENENAPGLRREISWPAELLEVSSKVRLKSSNVAVYVHCQFAYTPPTEKPGSGPFTGLEERNTAEYNAGTKVTCTTKAPGLQQLLEVSGTSLSKPGESEFDAEVGKLECGLFKGVTAGKLASEAFNKESNVPSVIETKKV